MIRITIGLMCLLEFKKEQRDKNRKNSAEKFFLIKDVLLCCFKTKKHILFKKTFVLKQAHICITNHSDTF